MIHDSVVDLGTLIRVANAIVVGEEVGSVAPFPEFVDVVPSFLSDAVGFAVVFPDANTTEALGDDIRTRYALIQVIIWVGGAVSSIVGT